MTDYIGQNAAYFALGILLLLFISFTLERYPLEISAAAAAALYAVTSVMIELITNNAVAVVLTLIVIALAAQLNVELRPLAVAVMITSSASFATSIGYQTNTLVYGAGNYRFTDFLKIGIPMSFIVGLTSSFTISIFSYCEGRAAAVKALKCNGRDLCLQLLRKCFEWIVTPGSFVDRTCNRRNAGK